LIELTIIEKNKTPNEIRLIINKLTQLTKNKEKLKLNESLLCLNYKDFDFTTIDHVKECELFIIQMNQNYDDNIFNSFNTDPNYFLTLLFIYLQEFKDPIIPFGVYDKCLNLDVNLIESFKWEPEIHYNTFLYLLKFFVSFEKCIHESSQLFFENIFINSMLRKKDDYDFSLKIDSKVNFLNSFIDVFQF
jgi:hypothetical protein